MRTPVRPRTVKQPEGCAPAALRPVIAALRLWQPGLEDAVAFAGPDRQFVEVQDVLGRIQDGVVLGASTVVGLKGCPNLTIDRQPIVRVRIQSNRPQTEAAALGISLDTQ